MVDEKMRAKYSRLLDWRVQAAALTGATLSGCAFGAWMQTSRLAREPSYCLGSYRHKLHDANCCTVQLTVQGVRVEYSLAHRSLS
jgi:hypothetical protein